MSTFIQVNIYNQTLDVLKTRGLDLKDILKTIGCPDTWITEVPIPASTRNAAVPTSSSSYSNAKPGNVDHPNASNSSSMSLHSPAPVENRNPLKKPFKSISAEIGFVQPLNLSDSLGIKPSGQMVTGETSQINSGRRATTLKGLFDDWDPTANLDVPGTSSDVPSDPALTNSVLKVPKEEVIDEEGIVAVKDDEPFEMDDTDLANQQERNIIEELIRQQNNCEVANNDDFPQRALRGKKKNNGDEPEALHYVIACNYPGCGLQYNWRVKYGKLRLLDHALTHSNRKIPCKLCGFECTNVRKMRSHYSKAHPTERVEGYGMKALVSGDYGNKKAEGADGEHDQQVSDDELKELWNACYSESLDLVGHATGFVDGDKYRRMTKRRKMERESINSMNFMF